MECQPHDSCNGSKLVVIGHSMGGTVTSEALKLSGNSNVVDTTVLTQAAVTSQFYASTVAPTPYYGAFGGNIGGATPRFSSIGAATTNLINFNNADDFALDTAGWITFNNLKPGGNLDLVGPNPNGFLDAEYFGDDGPPPVIVRELPNGTAAALNVNTNLYEMFAHGLYTSANPIGRENTTPGPFNGALNLKTIGFGGDRPDHSGQFNYTNLARGTYWKRLMAVAGL